MCTEFARPISQVPNPLTNPDDGPPAGNPNDEATCDVPAAAGLADSSNPTTVVGDPHPLDLADTGPDGLDRTTGHGLITDVGHHECDEVDAVRHDGAQREEPEAADLLAVVAAGHGDGRTHRQGGDGSDDRGSFCS